MTANRSRCCRVVSALIGLAASVHAARAMAQQADVTVESDKLVAEGKPRAAIEALKPSLQASPHDPRLVFALARAYLADKNPFWALNTLQDYAGAHPPACDARAMIAWIQIKQASFEKAEETLDLPGCEQPAEVRARAQLIRAWLAQVSGNPARSSELMHEAAAAPRLYEEDVTLLEALRARFDPGRMPWLSWKLDLAAGWTSNGLLGSPVDPARIGQDTASSVGIVNGSVRIVVPASASVRPVADLRLKTLALGAEPVSGLSYRQPSIRLGVLLGETYPRLLVAWHWDAVQLAGGDRYAPRGEGPIWFSEAHRGEYEIEVNDWMYTFGSAGRRTFRDMGRSRWELEEGVGMSMRAGEKVRLVAGASARWYRSENPAWDLYGATGMAQAVVQLPKDWQARSSASVGLDAYPRSGRAEHPPFGFFSGSEGRDRRDAIVRIAVSGWTPAVWGARLGAIYEYSHRWSTASDYEFTDHRVLGQMSWFFDSDRMGASTIDSKGRQALHYGLGASAAGRFEEEQRLREMMRQDESVRRGSSCLK